MLTTSRKMAVARVLRRLVVGARAVVGKGSGARVSRRGARWDLNLDEGIDLAVYLGLYQRLPSATLERMVPEGSVILDIGANIGIHTAALAYRVGPAGRVVAVEPTDYAFRRLLANLALNPQFAASVTPVQAALGRPGGASAFFSRWPLAEAGARHERHGGVLEPAGGARRMTLDALADEIAATDPRRIAFIKLDVDGNELDVLESGRQMLERHRPQLLVEVAPYVQDEVPGRFDALIGLLKGMGYRPELPGSDRAISGTADDIRRRFRDGAGADVAFIPA